VALADSVEPPAARWVRQVRFQAAWSRSKRTTHFAKNVSPDTVAKFWLPIVEMMLSLSNQLENAFSRNRISNDSISKAVPNFVGVVDSISALQKETFDKFASHTKLGY
jgi:hypothetical protein